MFQDRRRKDPSSKTMGEDLFTQTMLHLVKGDIRFLTFQRFIPSVVPFDITPLSLWSFLFKNLPVEKVEGRKYLNFTFY